MSTPEHGLAPIDATDSADDPRSVSNSSGMNTSRANWATVISQTITMVNEKAGMANMRSSMIGCG
ncbi:hypothetical protein, partial [Frateuria sp.]|uniref:hypothetical protein n=1 Tax=Frateuria sp. TaxID=2211372 RepID=UPI003F7E0463